MTRNSVNLNELLQEEYKPKESIYNGRYTKTVMFLLPSIGLSYTNDLVKKYLSNAFIDDTELEHDFKRPIFMLLKVKSFDERDWFDLNKYLDALSTKVYEYDLGIQDEYNLVMFVFEVPDKWRKEYFYFKIGKYSKMSKEYKALFPRLISGEGRKKKESVVWGAMNKSDGLKDSVANHFTVKDSNGNPLNMEEYEKFRKDIDTWEECWDNVNPEEEIYKYKKNLEK